MSRTNNLKELQEELRSLFDQEIDEQDAYDQLKEDPRFPTLRLAKVKTIYKKFQSKQELKPKRSKPVGGIQSPEKEMSPLLLKCLQQSERLSYFQTMMECDHEKHGCLKFLHDKCLDGRFIVNFDPIPGSKGKFSLIDTFSNKTSQIEIQLDPVEDHGGSLKFYPLAYDLVILLECTDYGDQDISDKISVSLFELDWCSKTIQKLHFITIEDRHRRFRFVSIIFDVMDSNNFILRLLHADDSVTLKHGSLINNEILFDRDIMAENNLFGEHPMLSANKLYLLDLNELIFGNMIFASITNLKDGTRSLPFSLDLSQIPGKFSQMERMLIACFTSDRMFMAVKLKDTKHYGIIWSKLETQQWIEMNFCTEKLIQGIRFIPDKNLLLIRTISEETALSERVHRFQTTLYRIPLEKPEKLTDLAWFTFVRLKSRLPNIDPYNEARKCLPYNSEIQSPFEE